MECREEVGCRGDVDCDCRSLVVGVCDHVRSLKAWHEFCNLFFVGVLVFSASVQRAKHDPVTHLVRKRISPGFVSMVSL